MPQRSTRREVLGGSPPATSAMVDRLAHTGLVSRTPDPHDHRRVQLTVIVTAQHVVGDTDPDTARRLHAVLKGINPQTRHHVIDVLIGTVRRLSQLAQTFSLIYIDYSRTKGCVETAGSAQMHESQTRWAVTDILIDAVRQSAT